jgi:hypothetical protein
MKIAPAFLCAIMAAIIATIPAISTGPDVWAETHVEYFDVVKNIQSFIAPGWLGYFALIPKTVALLYHTTFSDLISPDWFSRICTSVIIYISAFLSLSVVSRVSIKIMLALAIMYAFLVIHPSMNALTNIGYFLYIPLLTTLVINATMLQRTTDNLYLAKASFILALLSKPSIFFVPAILLLSRQPVFKITVTLLAGLQIGLSMIAAHSAASFDWHTAVFIVTAALAGLGATIDKFFFFGLFVSISGVSSFSLVILSLSAIALLVAAIITLARRHHIGSWQTTLVVLGVAAILFSAALQFTQFVTHIAPTLNVANLHQAIGSAAAMATGKFKLQYVIVISCVLLVLYLTLLRRVSSKSIFNVGVILAAASVSWSTLQIGVMALSSDVSSRLRLFEEFRQLNHHRCFPIAPLPGWAERVGGNIDASLFVLGGCRRYSTFDKFADAGFAEPRPKPPDEDLTKQVLTYLLMMDFKQKHLTELPQMDRECERLFSGVRTSNFRAGDRFFYLSGILLQNQMSFEQIRSKAIDCFRLQALPETHINLFVFLPEPNVQR